MEKTDIIIVGAGIVGLAIASQLSDEGKDVILVERHPNFGQEASSRNSEVIHSGIYYPENSLKAKLCLEGKKLLYQLCKEKNIAHKKLGKLIIATDDKETEDLEKLFNHGKNNGVEDLNLLSKKEIKRVEPHIQATAAIHSPSTGIIDTHGLMRCLEGSAREKGVIFAYNCEVVGIEREKESYKVHIRDVDGEELSLLSPVIINSAGLNSDKIAQMAGINIEKAGYKLHYSKGEYFQVRAGKSKFVNRLIYPVPQETSLGIHTVTDLQGELKLGPSAFYIEDINYDVDPSHKIEFYEATKRFLPFIEPDDLSPDMAGIRAKLQGPGEQKKDFVIAEEEEKGFPGLINLIGIDSPGLTASLAIARQVKSMI